MPLRNLVPLTFRPKGLSDTLDGTNAAAGAMALLTNLVPAPGSRSIFVPRAAATKQTSFAGFNTPGTVSLIRVIGTRVYGMVASQRFTNHDEPFIFDVLAQAFIPIQGVTHANTPLTPFNSGEWIPPTLSAVTNARIIVTHPGFKGAANGKFFGWFDVSNFISTSLQGNLTTGSNVIQSVNDGATSAPIIDGVAPGQTISGAGIPANTIIESLTNGTTDIALIGDTDGSAVINGILNTFGVLIGMGVAGPTIAAGSTVFDLTSTTITLNQATLGPGTNVAINVSGGGTITMSAPATASANAVPLTIAGGTFASPLWGAGNTNGFPLFSDPRCVFGFNGRAYFGVENFAIFSDINNPTQVSFASQALTIGDNTPITAMGGMPFTNTVTGGVVSDLIVFKGAEPMFQVLGDAALNTLALNLINGSVGTEAPNTICSTPLGLAYVAPDGLRILGFNGVVTDPIGAFGEGVAVPFIGAQYPSRMAAAYNQNTIRISVQNGGALGSPNQEYCLQMQEKIWHGPHTFPAALIEGYTAGSTVGFILTGAGIASALWFHTLIPNGQSVYVENGAPMSWEWKTSLLPDSNTLTMNLMIDTTLAMILSSEQIVTVTLTSESGGQLDQIMRTGPPAPSGTLWGAGIWGEFLWGAIGGYFSQYRLAWNLPIIFKQMFVDVKGASASGFAIGNLYMGYQKRRYILEDLQALSGYAALESNVAFRALKSSLGRGLLAGNWPGRQ